MYDHGNRIIMECRYVFFLEDSSVNPRVEQQCVELYEISRGKGFKQLGVPTKRTLDIEFLAMAHLRRLNNPMSQLAGRFE